MRGSQPSGMGRKARTLFACPSTRTSHPCSTCLPPSRRCTPDPPRRHVRPSGGSPSTPGSPSTSFRSRRWRTPWCRARPATWPPASTVPRQPEEPADGRPPPRRRLGDRRPRHPRQHGPQHLPRLLGGGRLGGLPARPGGTVPRRGGGRGRSHQMGRRAPRGPGGTDRLAVAGDSAGGNLAAVVAQQLRDAGGPAIAAQLLVYPAVDVTGDYASRWENAEGYFLDLPTMAWFLETTTPPTRPSTRTPHLPAPPHRPVRPAPGRRRHRGVRPASRRGRGVRRALRPQGSRWRYVASTA